MKASAVIRIRLSAAYQWLNGVMKKMKAGQ
jgi:hypothetical protein